MTEHQEQSMLIAWARMTEGTWPELALLHAIPNGGWRGYKTGKMLKREGLKVGDEFVETGKFVVEVYCNDCYEQSEGKVEPWRLGL